MSHCPYLPPELLDHIVDFLCDSNDTLKSCCLVSKSWIPRTRKSIFADISFRTTNDLDSWKTAFPNPSTSPACYTKTLFIGCPHVLAAAGTREVSWLSPFSHVTHLGMEIDGRDVEWITVTLVPFYGFSPVLKSLSIACAALPHSQTFNLIRSFPLLEDISFYMIDCDSTENNDHDLNEHQTAIQPSNSPVFTGSLHLCIHVRMDPIVFRLLSLPNGLHFRKLDLMWHREADVSYTTALVQECCLTLEHLKIDSGSLGTSSRQ